MSDAEQDDAAKPFDKQVDHLFEAVVGLLPPKTGLLMCFAQAGGGDMVNISVCSTLDGEKTIKLLRYTIEDLEAKQEQAEPTPTDKGAG